LLQVNLAGESPEAIVNSTGFSPCEAMDKAAELRLRSADVG
jgi:hypothetical protein